MQESDAHCLISNKPLVASRDQVHGGAGDSKDACAAIQETEQIKLDDQIVDRVRG